MCEFCPQFGPCSMPWCDNHWARIPQRPARLLIVPPEVPITRRQNLAIWVCLFGGLAYFGLVAWAAVRLGI